ncbi:low molecular weight protein-tyrosine-phosphatase [Urechidicola croceus]|uniref:protein-tyrosine-phosphatase n=1 Tax=Urechidicola croceus TaxID=1850246 RepID=A0A1D8P3J8_9FLAO|nr:low molecular weight protein-tyrosine-phosphatase [Urechidicola croceus]AOW19167.1 protein-tyrosine-phosphatase [Urechidicola croceus]
MVRVLMVCLGNICRSPLAEGILKSKTFLKNVKVDSAGTGAYHIGSLPDKRSIAIAKQHNLDITDHRGRQFSVKDFDDFDVIYVMDSSNYKNVIRLARNEQDEQKVKMILNEVFPGENLDVPDPYTGGSHGFRIVYDMLNEACDIIVEKLS